MRIKDILEDQGGFRSGRGCLPQISVQKQLVEKYSDKRKEVYIVLMDPEKAYDKICK